MMPIAVGLRCPLTYKNGSLYRQDEVALVKHDLYLDRDYQLLADIHCVGVRDAPAMSMYDWVDETLPLPNGIWRLGEHDERIPNGNMLQAIALARDYGYIA